MCFAICIYLRHCLEAIHWIRCLVYHLVELRLLVLVGVVRMLPLHLPVVARYLHIHVDHSMVSSACVCTCTYLCDKLWWLAIRPSLPVTVGVRRDYSFFSALVDASSTEDAPIRSDAAAALETLQPLQSPWDRPPAAAHPAAPARRGEEGVAQRRRAMEGAATSRSSSRHLRG